MRTERIQKSQLWGLVAMQGILLIILLFVLLRALTTSPEGFRAQTLATQSEPALQQNVLISRAEDQIANHNIVGGIALLDVTIQNGQPSARVFGARAAAYARIGDYTNAVQDYQQATVLAPENGDYQFGLCYARVEAGQYQDSITACTSSIQIMPSHFMSWNNRCYVRAYHVGDYQGAISDCTQAMALNAGHPFPHNNRARAHLMTGAYQQSITDATQSLMLDNPYSHLPLTNRGTAYLALGNGQAALQDYQAAINARPDYDEVYARLGELYRWQNQPQMALQAYCQYMAITDAPLTIITERINELGNCR